ncbi:hypothetical protein [Thalassomonas sp. M1454]|uniref:hypothetical protein n=1 Tax=Thalassomonas sp. M1454 TaxID=2594477 RepID=UPI0011813B9B|nr:hypothetical protein [Thalassomonas sp. M1454]TRX53488.1 hypothetical protein FNN08_14550 [Thalassomonas sp. M1454]
MKTTTIALVSTVLLTQVGCSFFQPDPCDEITFSSEQQAECSQLQRQIVNAKNEPIKRTELQRRYELDCVNLRYYRDDMSSDRCENPESVDVILEEEHPQSEDTKTETKQ